MKRKAFGMIAALLAFTLLLPSGAAALNNGKIDAAPLLSYQAGDTEATELPPPQTAAASPRLEGEDAAQPYAENAAQLYAEDASLSLNLEGKKAASAPGYPTLQSEDEQIVPLPVDGVYAILYADGTLVFQYGSATDSGKTVSKTYPLSLTTSYTESSVPWYNERASVRVASFRDKLSPASTACWFDHCSNLERIENMYNLDTSNVTTMYEMFYYCTSLKELDVSGWDVSKVTNMLRTFDRCWNVTTLDVSRWDTSSLENLGATFYYCYGLTTLDVSGFKTPKLTNICDIFNGCNNLQTLDLSSWDTSKVTGVRDAFRDCSSLTTIYASDKFKTSAVTGDRSMFSGCTSLVGGGGTKYDSGHVDTTYARIDAASAPGYFSLKGDDEQTVPLPSGGPYVVLYTDGTLTFQNGNAPQSGKTVKKTYPLDLNRVYTSDNYPSWRDDRNSIRVVNFADRFQPKATAFWFHDCANLERVDNIQNLDTSAATDMWAMFYGCSSLKKIDVSGFNTANVRDISAVFYGCESLTELDVSGWDTSNVKEMQSVFSGCSGLTTLDISAWSAAKVLSMYAMFRDCSNLKTIRASDKFTTSAVSSSSAMFSGCTSLVGGNGTKFDSDYTDKTYARIDAASAPGYFSLKGDDEQTVPLPSGGVYAILYDDGTLVFQNGNIPESGRTVKGTYEVDMNRVYGSEYVGSESEIPWYSGQKSIRVVSFKDKIQPLATQRWFYECSNLERIENIQNLDTSRVIKMRNMFWGCRKLEAADVSGWDTSKCTDMTGIFLFCEKIRELDVSRWDTSSATLMGWIFADCSGLTKLNLSSWNTANVTDMVHMFRNCSGLTELDLSAFNTAKVKNMEKMFSGCSNLKTIRASDKFTTSAVSSSSAMFSGCTSLVGGNGTKFDSDYTDKTYARIDGGTSAPGYFTGDAPRASYTVTWKNGDTVLKTETVSAGTVPAYSGATPSKAADKQYSYEFKGWSPAPAPVYSDTVYSAQFNTVTRTYTVTWKDGNSVLKTETVSAGTTPKHTHSKPGHVFKGWKPEPAPVFENTVYLAQFEEVPVTYTVTWKNGDTVLKTDKDVPAGTTPAYGGETPSKPGYVFTGWSPAPAPISADTTYVAQFKADENAFDVRRDAYHFGNGAKDFGYGPGPKNPISPDSVFLIFGDGMMGKYKYSLISLLPWNGNCAGMSGSTALFRSDKNINPKDFGKDTVWSLNIDDANGEISALTFIEAMQVAQYTETFAKTVEKNTSKHKQSVMPLVEAVRAASAKGLPTLIAIIRAGVGGHALLAVGVEDVTATGATLQIYDCNHPGELQRLTVRNSSDWSYDMGRYGVWGDALCTISYVPYETLEHIWENRGKPQAMNEALTVNVQNLSISNYLDEEVAALVDGQLVTDNPDVYVMPELSLYWPEERTIFLPKDMYTVTSNDENAELKASMIDQRMSASITTTANSVSFAVDDDSRLNSVTVVNAAPTDTYSLSMSTDFEDIECKDITINGVGQGETLSISMNQEGPPTLSNCNVASLSINGQAQETCVITATAGAGGSVTPSGETSVAVGTDSAFTFTPDAGYKIKAVQVDGSAIDDPKSEYVFEKVTENHTLTVLFEESPDAPAVSAAKSGAALRVTLARPDAVTVAVSYFDRNGKFVSASTQPGEKSLTFPLASASTARVILLDDDCKPLYDPLTVSLT